MDKMAKRMNMGKWIDDVFNSVGQYIHLETSDGVRREGKITGLRTRHITFNRRRVELVDEIELNGDPTDCVQMSAISSLSIE
jgi:hypothetical protein